MNCLSHFSGFSVPISIYLLSASHVHFWPNSTMFHVYNDLSFHGLHPAPAMQVRLRRHFVDGVNLFVPWAADLTDLVVMRTSIKTHMPFC